MMKQKNRNSNEKQKEKRDLGIYLHIPFCVKKCDYCDFLSAPANEETKQNYVDALIAELESYDGRTKEYIVPTIFFGGGTPSTLEAAQIVRIIETVQKVFQVDHNRLEATIEVNPGNVTMDKLLAYRAAGINRISFGLQSTDNKELKLLGRIHTYEQFQHNYHMAREAGFTNINIDLMSALPGQTLESWENTLTTVINLVPEHISAYSLIIEEGTPFFDRYGEHTFGKRELPDEDLDRLIYHRTKSLLESHGYHRYEISNYAREGYECRHNSSYWIGTEYLGIGLGASSLLNGARFTNMHDIKQYIALCNNYKSNIVTNNYMPSTFPIDDDRIGIRSETQLLTTSQRMEEFMFLGLRLCSGISRKTFQNRFGTDIEIVYGKELDRLISDKLLVSEGDRIYLTELGIDVSNSVLSVFLLN
jgi:oxygen-independent coproporphyrinogen III oxidase